MAKCKQARLCSFGLTKLLDNLSQIFTMRQKRNSQKKESSSFFENRQCEQQKVTRSAAPVVPRGLRKASVVNFTIRIDNASSKRSREAPRQWYRVGCEKRVLSIFGKHTREEIGVSQAALNNYFSNLRENDEPIYKNKKCTIRKGTLYVKPTTRGRKKQND